MIFSEPLSSTSGRILLIPPSERNDEPPLLCTHGLHVGTRKCRIVRAADKAFVDLCSNSLRPKFVGATCLCIDEAFGADKVEIMISADTCCGGFATDAMAYDKSLPPPFEENVMFQTDALEGTSRLRNGWPDGKNEYIYACLHMSSISSSRIEFRAPTPS
ncbi:hypothetical protein FB451DRAFT_1168939 [Mycena latifolia]|nr:hypothetical protein FB451DRAFT_1168939 [Mycena latifolia]